MPVYGDNTTSNSRYFQKGIFVDKAKVISVEDMSNYPKAPKAEIVTIGNGFQTELCLKLKVNTGIEMDMYVFGKYNWKTDPISGKQIDYLGWKQGGNAVQNLLFKLFGSFDTGENDVIPETLLNRLVGLEFYRLRYCQPPDKDYEGRPSFQTWNKFEKAVDGNDDVLYKEFLKSAGSIKGYDPNHFDDYNDAQRAGAETFNPSKEEEEDII